MAGALPTEPTDIFAALNRARVRYLVVGGIAAIAHGVPRATFDVDVAVELETANLRRLAEAMRCLGFDPRVPADVAQLADPRIRRAWTRDKAMKVFSFIERTPPFRVVDVMVRPLAHFDELHRRRFKVVYRGIPMPILPLPALIRMKRAAGRPEDRQDVQWLQMIRRLRRRAVT